MREKMNKLKFIKDMSTGIETVSFEEVNISYPVHTHIGHFIFGIITKGKVKITIDHKEFTCCEGEMFSVALNLPHSIEPISNNYSMISICVPQDDDIERNLDIIRKCIIGNPEVEINIAQMAEMVHISKYHMLRRFSEENGLTPHKFQLQCRIRKAQELLRDGMKVVDVAAVLGFCDQSHLCRVFKKQVGISPEEYINSAIISKANN